MESDVGPEATSAYRWSEWERDELDELLRIYHPSIWILHYVTTENTDSDDLMLLRVTIQGWWGLEYSLFVLI